MPTLNGLNCCLINQWKLMGFFFLWHNNITKHNIILDDTLPLEFDLQPRVCHPLLQPHLHTLREWLLLPENLIVRVCSKYNSFTGLLVVHVNLISGQNMVQKPVMANQLILPLVWLNLSLYRTQILRMVLSAFSLRMKS